MAKKKWQRRCFRWKGRKKRAIFYGVRCSSPFDVRLLSFFALLLRPLPLFHVVRERKSRPVTHFASVFVASTHGKAFWWSSSSFFDSSPSRVRRCLLFFFRLAQTSRGPSCRLFFGLQTTIQCGRTERMEEKGGSSARCRPSPSLPFPPPRPRFPFQTTATRHQEYSAVPLLWPFFSLLGMASLSAFPPPPLPTR